VDLGKKSHNKKKSRIVTIQNLKKQGVRRAPLFHYADRDQTAAVLAAPLRNANRSALIVSAWVVGMPCGKSL